LIERQAKVGKWDIVQRGAEEVTITLLPGVVVRGKCEVKGAEKMR
jgi:hypothetical protein